MVRERRGGVYHRIKSGGIVGERKTDRGVVIIVDDDNDNKFIGNIVVNEYEPFFFLS